MPKNDDVFKNSVSKCFGLIRACNKSTQNLLGYAMEGNLEGCDFESKNRGRLIKIIQEKYLEIKEIGMKKDVDTALFGKWNKEFQSFIQDSAKKDVEILNVLKGSRENLKKAIASTYRMRKKIQSYSSNRA